MEFIPSCDTLAINKSCTASGCNILAKNSDRDATESQPLIAFPAKDHAPGEKLKCTYIEIDEVPHTYAMIGSKPWWMWGFEMGANECGVAIGNEAEYSNIPVSDKDALLGMDLLRLGLERGATAKEALDVIIELLEKYGQGGACKYGCTIADFSYHNTFIISDPDEIYILETVDRQWCYRKVNDVQGISNVYTIGDDYDAMSDGLVELAVKNGLHNEGEKLNFAQSFMLIDAKLTSGIPRYRWSTMKLRELAGKLDAENTLEILRGHYEGTFYEELWSPVSTTSVSVCMHAQEPRGSQSAATMVVEYHDNPYKELIYTYWASMCPPCCTFIAPFYNTGYIPAKLGGGTNKYSDDSFWWTVNRLVCDIETDYNKYIQKVNAVRPDMEKSFRNEAKETEAKALELLKAGKNSEACDILNALTDRCVDKIEETVKSLIKEIEADMKNNTIKPYRLKYMKKYRDAVDMNF